MAEDSSNGVNQEPRVGLPGRITALLFVAAEPLELATLARALEAGRGEVERALMELVSGPPAGLIVQRQGDQVQLVTDPGAAADVRRLRGVSEPQRLSRAALEVLSVVAYRQPTTRGEIEAVRGVNSDHALETLLARGLVTELGRRETLGRPMTFGTTLEFLQLAGLRTLEELPPLEPGAERIGRTEADATLC
jgi:segregation and condensation protein B